VVGRIVEHATQRPDALAVSTDRGELTYRSLLDRASDLSVRLRAAGVSRNDLVALCVPRSADLVVGALGILMAGAGYVALDPDQPRARLQFMVEDCTASVVVASAEIVDRLSTRLPIVHPVDSQSAYEAGDFGEIGRAEPPADGIAYAVYTSGSTGQPKGVLIAHAGVLNLIAWHQRTFGLDPSDRTTLISNPSFDAAVWEIWPCLTAGASLHIPPDATRTDPIALRDWLLAERITVCFLPTPLAEMITAVPWPSSAPLRWMLTGGDVLHERPAPGLPFALVNNYGVSEATVVATSTIVSPTLGESESAPSVGPPIDGVVLRVVDGDGRVVTDGVDGELLICGCSVAIGYLGRPELTAEKFGVDPCDPRSRAYRTGDRVRINDEGSVDFLGRLDDQIQVRGLRVETGEIVAVVNGYSAVQSSAVVAVDDPAGTELVLFVVAVPGIRIDDDLLHGYLAERLPSHMLPSRIVSLTAMPITPNGKIDRASLVATANRQSLAIDDDLNHGSSTVEAALAKTVAELLRLPRVAVDENFFLLGGHSMLGAQLIVRIADTYGVEMTLLTLFDNPTVAEMAAVVERLVIEEISGMDDDALLSAAAELTKQDAQR
jgi:amino acid adenylation domain-containing protein